MFGWNVFIFGQVFLWVNWLVLMQVGSRMVIVVSGIVMVAMGVLGKVGAIFTTIPSPVMGGMFIVMFGVITAAGVSNLQVPTSKYCPFGCVIDWKKYLTTLPIFSMQIWIHPATSSFLASLCFLLWSFLTGYWSIQMLLLQVKTIQKMYQA